MNALNPDFLKGNSPFNAAANALAHAGDDAKHAAATLPDHEHGLDFLFPKTTGGVA